MRVRRNLLYAWLVCAAGCSATTGKLPSKEPVGCCCSYGDCRDGFTEQNCVKEGEFQGWTYAWHTGPCTKADKPVLK